MRATWITVIGSLAFLATSSAGPKSKCNKECRTPTADEITAVKKWLAALPKLRSVPADTFVLDSSDPPKDRKVNAEKLKTFLFAVTDKAKTKIALADQLAAPYESLEHYTADDGLVTTFPKLAKKLASAPDLRLLVAHYTNGFDSHGVMIKDAEDADAERKPGQYSMKKESDRQEGQYKMTKPGPTVTTDLWLVYDKSGKLVWLAASHMVLE